MPIFNLVFKFLSCRQQCLKLHEPHEVALRGNTVSARRHVIASTFYHIHSPKLHATEADLT